MSNEYDENDLTNASSISYPAVLDSESIRQRPFDNNICLRTRSGAGKKGGLAEDKGESVHMYTDAKWTMTETSSAGFAFQHYWRILSWYEKDHAQSSGHTEAKVLCLVASLVVKYRWSSAIFHYDAHDLVLSINRKLSPSWDCTRVLSDFWSSAGLLLDWSCLCIPGTENTLAHDLARPGRAFDHQLLCII